MDRHTLKLVQDSFHGTRAAAAAHGDVELILVVGHFDLEIGMGVYGVAVVAVVVGAVGGKLGVGELNV